MRRSLTHHALSRTLSRGLSMRLKRSGGPDALLDASGDMRGGGGGARRGGLPLRLDLLGASASGACAWLRDNIALRHLLLAAVLLAMLYLQVYPCAHCRSASCLYLVSLHRGPLWQPSHPGRASSALEPLLPLLLGQASSLAPECSSHICVHHLQLMLSPARPAQVLVLLSSRQQQQAALLYPRSTLPNSSMQLEQQQRGDVAASQGEWAQHFELMRAELAALSQRVDLLTSELSTHVAPVPGS